MRKASVHPGSGLSERGSATTLPHADPHYASEPTAHTHTHTLADTQTQKCAHTHTHSHTFTRALSAQTDKHTSFK